MIQSRSSSRCYAFVNHDPISIHSNQDFDTQGWTGDGTISNPYIIENLNITSRDRCISISATTVHFVIRNCFLKSTEGYSGFALDFNNVNNGTVEGCTLTSFEMWMAPGSDVGTSGFGGKIVDTSNCTFRNNLVRANGEGLHIESCSNLVFQNNAVTDNQVGAQISSSSELIFEDNQFLGNWEGIWTIYLDSCSFRNQTIEAKNIGLLVRFSMNLEISDCKFHHCGIRFWGIHGTQNLRHSITGNTVNDYPLLYIHSQSNKLISGKEYGQVIIANSDNITLTEFRNENASSAIQLLLCTDCHVKNCTTFNNSEEGIYILDSTDCNILNTTLMNNIYGVRIDSSSNISIEESLFLFNFRGISAYEVAYLIIRNNDILNSSYVGVKITEDSVSIDVNGNRIVNSTFGIVIQYSINGIIRNNIVYDCSGVGILLSFEVTNFRVYYNYIGWNVENARDIEGNNIWDDRVSQGNNWTDYCGSGVYTIPGENQIAVDRYPSLLYDPSRPNITIPICTDSLLINILYLSAGIFVGSILLVLVLSKRKRSPTIQAMT